MLLYGDTQFWIPGGVTWSFTSAINGDTAGGGDYHGPIVIVGVPNDLQQEVTISTVSVRFISRNSDGFTSQAVYDFSVTNPNSFPVTVRFDIFCD